MLIRCLAGLFVLFAMTFAVLAKEPVLVVDDRALLTLRMAVSNWRNACCRRSQRKCSRGIPA